MVKIRLRRVGKKKQPVYKLVVADSTTARDGKFIETIGQYNPLVPPVLINVKEDRLFLWLKRGAQPTDTMRSLLQRKGLWLRWSLMRKGKDEAAIATEMEKWQALQAEKAQRQDERSARRKEAARKKRKAAETPEQPAEAPAAAPAGAAPAAAPAGEAAPAPTPAQ